MQDQGRSTFPGKSVKDQKKDENERKKCVIGERSTSSYLIQFTDQNIRLWCDAVINLHKYYV